MYSGVSNDTCVALCGEIVDLVRLRFLHDADQVGRIGHVAVVRQKAHIFFVRVLVHVLDTTGVERRRASPDAVDPIAFVEQEFGKISAVLAGNAADQCDPFSHRGFRPAFASEVFACRCLVVPTTLSCQRRLNSAAPLLARFRSRRRPFRRQSH